MSVVSGVVASRFASFDTTLLVEDLLPSKNAPPDPPAPPTAHAPSPLPPSSTHTALLPSWQGMAGSCLLVSPAGQEGTVVAFAPGMRATMSRECPGIPWTGIPGTLSLSSFLPVVGAVMMHEEGAAAASTMTDGGQRGDAVEVATGVRAKNWSRGPPPLRRHWMSSKLKLAAASPSSPCTMYLERTKRRRKSMSAMRVDGVARHRVNVKGIIWLSLSLSLSRARARSLCDQPSPRMTDPNGGD